MRDRSYFQQDDPPQDVGDEGWAGVFLNAEAGQLTNGLLADGQNMRCRTGRPTTRKGLLKPAWLNTLRGERTTPWNSIHGKPEPFRDPNGIEWLMLAANGCVYAIRPYNVPFRISVPAGVRLQSEVVFVQAFNKMFMLRGEKLAPLVLSDFDHGFEDMIPRWDATRIYLKETTVAHGPWLPGAVTANGLSFAVATPAPHGLITGSDIQVRATTTGAQDGRYTVQVIDENHFEFQVGAAQPPSPTLQWTVNSDYWVSNADTVVGDEPGIASKWVRDWLVLPNCTNGIYVNNRLLVTTSWLPGGELIDSGYGPKRDFVAASYVLDYIHFSPKNEFRINQGSDDSLQCLLKVGDTAVLCLKDRSIGLLSNVTGDTMSELRLEMIIRNYGITNSRAATEVGRDVVFVSPRRGVVSLQQTQTNQFQGMERAFSDPIKPWISQIDWNMSDKIRVAYWDDKLYIAAPVASNQVISGNLLSVVPFTDFLDIDVDWYPRTGDLFQWTPDKEGNETLLVNSESFTTYHEFIYDGSPFVISRSLVPTQPAPARSTLKRVLRRVNSAVMVYDYQTNQWQPIDRGTDLAIREFFVMNVDGSDRLCCVTEDNFLNIYEESDAGDQVTLPGTWNGLGWTEIESFVLTRGYTAGTVGFKAGQFARAVLATHWPTYSIRMRTEGVSEESVIVMDRHRDRRVYERPTGVKRWQVDNANNDFLKPYRQDYTVIFETGENPLQLSTGENLDLSFGDFIALTPTAVEIDLWDGIPMDLRQEVNHSLRANRLRGRWHQVLIENKSGVCELRAIAIDLQTVERSQGPKL